jgi:ribosomal protein L30/L7E
VILKNPIPKIYYTCNGRQTELSPGQIPRPCFPRDRFPGDDNHQTRSAGGIRLIRGLCGFPHNHRTGSAGGIRLIRGLCGFPHNHRTGSAGGIRLIRGLCGFPHNHNPGMTAPPGGCAGIRTTRGYLPGIKDDIILLRSLSL